MSLTVYVGHCVHQAEAAFLWEFQANAAAHGFKIVLAQYKPVSTMTASRQAQIQTADAFLAVITRPGKHVEAEAAFAAKLKKPVFVYALEDVPFKAPAGAVVMRLARGTDAPTFMGQVAHQLKGVRGKGEEDTALGTLIGVGAVLFLLAALFKEK